MINQQFTIPFQSNYCAQAVNRITLNLLRDDVFIAVYAELAGRRIDPEAAPLDNWLEMRLQVLRPPKGGSTNGVAAQVARSYIQPGISNS